MGLVKSTGAGPGDRRIPGPGTIAIWGLLAACLPGCDESLPPRLDPETVLSSSLSMNSPAITVEQGIVTGGGTVVVSSANLYDDVLSERSRIRGVLTFRLRAAPDSFRTLIYTESDITIPTMLDGSILTMGVHQTLSLAHPWDYRTEAGTPLWSPLRFTRGFTDKGREFYRSDTTWMQVAGTLQLFEKHQAIDVALREFPVVFTLFETPPPNPVAGVP